MALIRSTPCLAVFLHLCTMAVSQKAPNSDSVRAYSGCGQNADTKVVDGSSLTNNKYPWVVRISAYYTPIENFNQNGTDACSIVKTERNKMNTARLVTKNLQTIVALCGGSMITRRHVLTAGHCLLPEEFQPRYVVRYGSARTSRQSTAFVAKVYKHPNCHMVNQDRAVDDVAVLVLRSALPVPPVCLPRAGASLPSQVTVAGWGNTIPSIDTLQLPELLKEAQMQVVSKDRCQEEHSYANLQHQICAEPASGFPGVGDSGGPLMTKGPSGEWTLVGVVSWGNETRFRTSPFVFSDVAALLSWIQDVVALPTW
ncbi:chymotrypsinogen B-like [Haemaphysalis longicornis]